MNGKPKSYKPIDRLHVGLEIEGTQRIVGTLAWSRSERRSYFEYHNDFLAAPLPLSPYHLPVKGNAQPASHAPFDGLHGLFNDSLPDGWGKLLVDRRLRKGGIDFRTVTALDRLAIVGTRGMGALTFVPELAFEDGTADTVDLDWVAEQADLVQNEVDAADVDMLQNIQGGSGGARPKIVVGLNSETNRVMADIGGALPKGYDPWIVKFRSRHDSAEIGAEEFAYAQMAKSAGIEMSETRLLETSKGGRFFATRRFDRSFAGRRHVHTVSGLLNADHRSPAIEYDDLLKLTRALTRDERYVRQMFGRMAFNVLARNRDDHTKNHAFIMDLGGIWHPTPAYDLTLSEGPGGEQSLAVSGEGRAPGQADMLRVAERASIPKTEALSLIDQVRSAIDQWPHHGESAGVPRGRIAEIDLLLNGQRSGPKRRTSGTST